jgi:hypothetical protein
LSNDTVTFAGDIDIAICEKNMNYLKVGKFFEIYNQKKKRNETKSGNRQKRKLIILLSNDTVTFV